MRSTFGFIGAGNMGGALARAAAKTLAGDAITVSDQLTDKAATLADQIGCNAADVQSVAKSCDFIFLGVKPQVMAGMLSEIAPVLAARKDSFVLVSMAAGICMEDIRRMAGGAYPVIRIMPNIPASVGGGVILYDATENVSQEAINTFCANMQGAGLVDRLPEKLIDAGSALSGCGPAFVSMFIEALADGAVKCGLTYEALADGAVACGLPRSQAVAYAAQTVAGTAKMILESGIHPGALKDAVCSPGGSTIMGVNTLEQGGFRANAMDAVIAAYEKTTELGK